jgi:AraC-like DNA-binding protein
MPTFVRHNDVSSNFLERGRTQVLLATGYRYQLGAGRLSFFWSAIPHKVEMYTPRSVLQWFVVPLGTFLRWTLPEDFTRQLMRGRVFFEPDPEEGPHDRALLDRSRRAITTRDAEAEAIMLLELEARVRRLAVSCSSAPTDGRALPASDDPLLIPHDAAGSQAERMLLLIAEHFREPLTGEDVAANVGLNPSYAGTLFRQHVGMGLHDYITECRLSHAKALLATTPQNILDVALDSGFGSVSQFHAVFRKSCGCTPRAYRMSLRQPASDVCA